MLNELCDEHLDVNYEFGCRILNLLSVSPSFQVNPAGRGAFLQRVFEESERQGIIEYELNRKCFLDDENFETVEFLLIELFTSKV